MASKKKASTKFSGVVAALDNWVALDDSDDESMPDERSLEGGVPPSTGSAHLGRDVRAALVVVASFAFAAIFYEAIEAQAEHPRYGATSQKKLRDQLIVMVLVHVVAALGDAATDLWVPLAAAAKRDLAAPLYTLTGWIYWNFCATGVNILLLGDEEKITWRVTGLRAACAAALTLVVAGVALLGDPARPEYGADETAARKLLGHYHTIGRAATTLPVAGLWHIATRDFMICATRGHRLADAVLHRLCIRTALVLALGAGVEGLARAGYSLGAAAVALEGRETHPELVARFAALRRKTLTFLLAWTLYNFPDYYMARGWPRRSRLGGWHVALWCVLIYTAALALFLFARTPPLPRATNPFTVCVAIAGAALGPQLGWAIKDAYVLRVDLLDSHRVRYLALLWSAAGLGCVLWNAAAACLVAKRNAAPPVRDADVELASVE